MSCSDGGGLGENTPPLSLATDKGKLGLNSGPWACASADGQAIVQFPAPRSKSLQPPPPVSLRSTVGPGHLTPYILLGASFQYAVHSNKIT